MPDAHTPESIALTLDHSIGLPPDPRGLTADTAAGQAATMRQAKQLHTHHVQPLLEELSKLHAEMTALRTRNAALLASLGDKVIRLERKDEKPDRGLLAQMDLTGKTRTWDEIRRRLDFDFRDANTQRHIWLDAWAAYIEQLEAEPRVGQLPLVIQQVAALMSALGELEREGVLTVARTLSDEHQG